MTFTANPGVASADALINEGESSVVELGGLSFHSVSWDRRTLRCCWSAWPKQLRQDVSAAG